MLSSNPPLSDSFLVTAPDQGVVVDIVVEERNVVGQGRIGEIVVGEIVVGEIVVGSGSHHN